MFVHRVGDSSTLGGHPCYDGGHQDDTHGVSVTMGWVSPLSAAGGTGVSAALSPTCCCQEQPQLCRSPSSQNHGAGSRWLGAL